ncbi:MAG: hypothetical protein BMS9Abin29_2463 [Gemmatimonadota bacterium]|nr:MAG: hypothetical protein BMS9Abin29_2463 [Gemmatimonadota bacterium]
MAKSVDTQESGRLGGGTLPVKDEETLRQLYYAGAQLPSPMGGFLEVLHVQAEEDGSGTVIFECLSSSLRFRLPLKAATRTERKTVRDRIDAGMEPECPRHEGGRRLHRVGRNLICPACGVRYAKA